MLASVQLRYDNYDMFKDDALTEQIDGAKNMKCFFVSVFKRQIHDRCQNQADVRFLEEKGNIERTWTCARVNGKYIKKI